MDNELKDDLIKSDIEVRYDEHVKKLLSNKKTLASKLCSLIALCDSDFYLTTSFRHCQELFLFHFALKQN